MLVHDQNDYGASDRQCARPTHSAGIDLTTANPARVYDYLLGGRDNFAVDRELADKGRKLLPHLPRWARANREFLVRAVGYLVEEAGIRQFIDIGSGLPTRDNVHEVAQRLDRDARVAYVDHDPVVAAHGRALLATSDKVVFVEADLCAPETILSDSGLRALIDFSEPVAVLLVAVLHFLADDDGPHRVVRTLRNALCEGSHLAISHAVHRGRAAEMEAARLYTGRASVPLVLRPREDVARFFEGFELVAPGLPPVPLWRPLVRPRAGGAVPIVGGVGALRADSHG